MGARGKGGAITGSHHKCRPDHFIRLDYLQQITLNINKTKFTIFNNKSRNKQVRIPNIMMKSEVCRVLQIFGVFTGSKSKFWQTCYEDNPEGEFETCYTVQIRKFLNQYVSLQLYKSLILSVVECGDLFLSSCQQHNIGKLQQLQNHILRLIFNSPIKCYLVDLNNKARLLPLAYRRKISTLRVMHIYIYAIFWCKHKGWSSISAEKCQ